jgi:hypothetical protein
MESLKFSKRDKGAEVEVLIASSISTGFSISTGSSISVGSSKQLSSIFKKVFWRKTEACLQAEVF